MNFRTEHLMMVLWMASCWAKARARMHVRTLHGERFTIPAGRSQKTLVMNDFRQGNIILSPGWLDRDGLSATRCPSATTANPWVRVQLSLAPDSLGEIEISQLRALEISPSYGASLMAIFKESEMKSSYLQP